MPGRVTHARSGLVAPLRVLRVPDGADLHLFGADGGGDAAPPSDDGAPAVVARVNGCPLELRAWRDWPRGVAEAIRHPSGIWVALRLLDAPRFR